jgi:hypothetical protein
MRALFYFLIFMVALASCVTNKPYYDSVSQFDYNKRCEIANPVYKKTISPLGIGSIVAGTIAGGYVGYRAKLVNFNDGQKQQSFDVGGAVLGAAIGYTATYFANRLAGWGKTVNNVEPEKWLKKTNTPFKYLGSSAGSIKVIHHSIEPDFTIQTLQDAHDFAKVFRNSSYTNQVTQTALTSSSIQRQELLEMIDLFPTSASLTDFKRKYVRLSPSIETLLEASKRFPETKLNTEYLASGLVNNYADAALFNKNYRSSTYNKQVVLNALRNSNTNQVSDLADLFGNDINITSSDFGKLISDDSRRQKYFESRFILSAPKSFEDIVYTSSQYQWLQFSQKSHSILQQFWNIGYKTIPDGNQLLWLLRKLPEGSLATTLKLKQSEVEAFINTKLTEEVKSKVFLSESKELGSNNPEWEKWKTSSYTAGVVEDKGEAKYLMMGQVQNASRFDLPIKIDVSGHLIVETKAQGTGFVSNLIARFAGTQRQDIGNQQASFQVPLLRKGEKTLYAAMLDFGTKTKSMGINVNDWIKFQSELLLTNISRSVSFSNAPLSSFQQNQQEQWQVLAKNGFPDAKLTDFLRGNEVREDEWHESHMRMIEAARKAKEDDIRTREVASNTCYSILYVEADEIPTFKFSGYDYKPTSDVYQYRCNSGSSSWYYLVNLTYDTEAKTYVDSSWKAGWYWYMGSGTTMKSGPYGSKEEAAKKGCKCN